MSNKGNHSAETPHPFGDAIDKGLAEAFGDARAQRPAPSVLQALQARTGSVLGLHLDSGGLDDAPVRVTEEARKLRDPAGRYQVLGEIGRGGVGIVYKSRDVDLGRDVAMKVLKDEYAQRPDVLARFVEEAQIGGQLQHPGIVPVYDLGMHAGDQLYFAMKLVRGETLAAQLARRASPAEDRRRLLGVFEQICQTVAYAHARRVVHRDLKPANVMIGAFGEVQVVDWGFAKVLALEGAADEAHPAQRAGEHSVIETVRSGSGSGAQSVAGCMMGTPAYMPPEQARGDVELLDRRSDVFALGAILCEILCGEAPYRAEDGDLVRQAASAELDGALARLRACGADEALVALCTECLAPARRARPASAAEVAERVGAWLTSVEERARQAELGAAEARYKQRATLLAGAAGLVVLLLGAGAWIWMQGEVQDRRAGAAQRVAAAMSAASGARGQAQAAGLDPLLWAAAASSAEQLVALARSDDVAPAARAEAEALLASVRQDESAAAAEAARRARDAAMLERLELLRMPPDDDAMLKGGTPERRRLDEAYSAAFAAYLGGPRLSDGPADAVLTSLQQGDIEVELATSMDHWALVRDSLQRPDEDPDPGTARIRELAALLDPADPWRVQLRALLPRAAEERERLKSLAEHADFISFDAATCRVLSEALRIAGEEMLSVDVLRRGQALHPTDFDLCFHLAFELQQARPPRWQEALDTYRIAQALRPEHNEVLHRQGIALWWLQRPAEAERIFGLLLARDPGNPHWLTHMGIVLAQQGKLDEAIAAYESALEVDPRFPMAHTYLGNALRERGNLDAAIESYRRAIEVGPAFAIAYDELGEALQAQGELDQAIECSRRAIELDPTMAPTHLDLGNALQKQGKLDEAIESYQRAIQLDPTMASGYVGLGMALRAQGKLDEAIESYRRAVELDPLSAMAHDSLGSALGDQGKLDEAMESHRRAVEIDPQSAIAYGNLGIALEAQGKLDEAIESYRRSMQIDPTAASTIIGLGNALQRQGKMDEAVGSYRRALEIDPRSAAAHDNLGHALVAQGKLDEAIESFRRALEIDPLWVNAYNNLGTAFLNQGKVDDAIESYRRALEIDPTMAPANVNLGIALRSRDVDGALAAFERAAELFAQQDGAFARQWESYSREQAQSLRHIPALEEVLAGRRPAVSSEEWADAILVGYRQGRYAEAVALTEHTLQGLLDPSDGAWRTYNSACAAALLAADTAAELSTAERARLRGLARAWLAREIERLKASIPGGGGPAAEARRWLEHALQDPDFASVRGDALADLPEPEQAAWQELWASIARALEEDGK